MIERTGEVARRVDKWLDDYMTAFAAAGYDEAGCALIRTRLDNLPWVDSLEEAQSRVINWNMGLAGGEPTIAQTDEYMAGWRTWASVSEAERIEQVASHMGVRYDEAERWFAQLAPEPVDTAARECALYRHFDGGDVLLYVGISNAPETRHEQHRRNSPWFKFVTRTTVEWFTSLEVAAASEREAIRVERPIFNRTHNSKGQQRTVEYLMERVQ